MDPEGSVPHSQGLFNNPRLYVMFLNTFYNMKLLPSRQTPKLEDHFLSAVHDCLFNIFAAHLHIWRPTSPSTTRGDVPCCGDRISIV